MVRGPFSKCSAAGGLERVGARQGCLGGCWCRERSRAEGVSWCPGRGLNPAGPQVTELGQGSMVPSQQEGSECRMG